MKFDKSQLSIYCCILHDKKKLLVHVFKGICNHGLHSHKKKTTTRIKEKEVNKSIDMPSKIFSKWKSTDLKANLNILEREIG